MIINTKELGIAFWQRDARLEKKKGIKNESMIERHDILVRKRIIRVNEEQLWVLHDIYGVRSLHLASCCNLRYQNYFFSIWRSRWVNLGHRISYVTFKMSDADQTNFEKVVSTIVLRPAV